MPKKTSEEMREWMLRIRPKSNKGKKYFVRKAKGPNITKENLRKAIKGSFGIMVRIAKRLHVGYWAVREALKRPGWEDMKTYYEEESKRVVDEAELTVLDMVRQRDEYPTALAASKLVLTSKGADRGWLPKKEVTLQGGDKPIQVTTSVVDVDALNLPLDLRRQLLASIELSGVSVSPSVNYDGSPMSSSTTPQPEQRKVIRVQRILK